ncbi:hypothetical protein [Streptomyces sp. NPDC048650]|uniref:hypothetical protein n=1 Tax=Streptomyces sp. NPDC048650 TaxID=3365583 RepID=UPI00371D9F33
MAWYADDLDEMPYSVGKELRTALRTVDTAPLDAECPHGDDGHPESDDALPSLLGHLYAPDEFPAPSDAAARERWLCSRHLARRAQDAIAALDEYFYADEEEGEEGEGNGVGDEAA